MTNAEASKELAALLKKLRAQHDTGLAADGTALPPPAIVDPDEPVLGQFLRSFLHWESTGAKAAQAIKKLEAGVVDFNELRVCMPEDVVALIGERYPRAHERAQRLRAALNDLYSREHKVSLEHLAKLSKRDVKDYLDSLEGVPSYVSSRVALLCFGAHTAPVDARVLRRLLDADVVDDDVSIEDAAATLERKVRAGELLETYLLLQAHADELSGTVDLPAAGREPPKPPPKRKPAGKSPAKKRVDAD